MGRSGDPLQQMGQVRGGDIRNIISGDCNGLWNCIVALEVGVVAIKELDVCKVEVISSSDKVELEGVVEEMG